MAEIKLCPSCAGSENYHEPHCQQERDRLRAVNAQLLEALGFAVTHEEKYILDPEPPWMALARAAIEEARK